MQTKYDADTLRALTAKLMDAKMRMMKQYSFYGIVLAELPFVLDTSLDTAATDGEKLYFSPDFLQELTPTETDFILLHEVLHVCLKHMLRQKNRNHYLFNVACDIVVNSHILHMGVPIKVAGTESMHLAPDGKEGWHYTAEEVYDMLIRDATKRKKKPSDGDGDEGVPNTDGNQSEANATSKKGGGKAKQSKNGAMVDSHERWDNATSLQEAAINRALSRAAAMAPKMKRGSNNCGDMPAELERIIRDLNKSRVNWREELRSFLQPDIYDYTYLPPDKKRSDEFFYPALRSVDGSIHHIMFMVDTSCSVTDDDLAQLLGEIQGAVNQFGGKMDGYVGFFDAAVHGVTQFDGDTDLTQIKPVGGGGTSFHCVFEYLRDTMATDLPEVLVILTDGWAPFPHESAAMEIPVLWVLYGEGCNTDIPWGRKIVIDEL